MFRMTLMRFSEAIALTPKDFDFSHQMLSINKTWDYKGNGGFLPTKNKSSVRKIQIDWQTVIQFSELVKKLPADKPIFVKKEHIYNSTVNDILARHCKRAKVPVISVHGFIAALCRCFYSKCGPSTRAFEHDNYAKDISSHHPGTRKSRRRPGNEVFVGA